MKEDEEQGVTSQASVMHTLTEDVRQQLYSVLKRQGMIDKMKSEMRHKLVMELTTKRPMPPPPAADGTRSLSQRAADSLVADYLTRRQMEYSLSVFVPEAGLSGQKLLSGSELLDLLHVNPHSKFHRQLSHALSNNSDSFLWAFLRQLAERAASGATDTSCQTEGRPLIPLSERLSSIERHFDSARVLDTATGQALFEERLLAFQRDLETRLRRDHDADLARFKATELAKMRAEERERLSVEFEAERRESEARARERLRDAAERERAAGEAWRRQQETWEREAHQRRAAVLAEVEAVRQRETAVRREQEVTERERRAAEEKRRTSEEELRQRDGRLRQREAEYEAKMNEERSRVRLEEEKKFLDRWRELELTEVRVKEEVRLAEAEKEGIRRMREEVTQRQALFDEMEVADYPTVKQENAALRQEVEGLKGRVAELRQDYEKERGKLEAVEKERAGPSKTELEVRRELEKAQESVRMEKAMADHAMQGLQKRLQEEMNQHQALLQRFEEQSLQLREMNQEVEDLRAQLRHTETALTNELYRRPRTSGLTPRTARTGDLSTARSGRDLEPMDELFSARTPRFQETATDLFLNVHHEPDVDDLVADTKWRLRTLDQETENLQTAYRSFQHRLSNPVYAGPPPMTEKAPEPRVMLPVDLGEPLVPPPAPTDDWRRSGMAESLRRPMSGGWATLAPLDVVEKRPTIARESRPEIGVDAVMGGAPTAVGDVPSRGVETHGHVSFEMPLEERSERAEGLANTSHDAGSTAEQLGPVASGLEAASTAAQSLDETWRSEQEEEEEDWEERRRRRDAEKAQREQEEWEEQQRELSRLRGDPEPAPAPPVKEEKEEEKDAGIDPVMQRYMAMVAERRQLPQPVVEPAPAREDSEEETDRAISEADIVSDRSKSSGSFW